MAPVEDDPDMWAVLSRLITQAVLFIQVHGAYMAAAALMSMLVGMERGTDSKKIRVRMGIAALLVWGFGPVIISKFALDPIWTAGIALFIGWQGLRVFKWTEALFLKRAGLTREDVEQEPRDGTERRKDRREGEEG